MCRRPRSPSVLRRRLGQHLLHEFRVRDASVFVAVEPVKQQVQLFARDVDAVVHEQPLHVVCRQVAGVGRVDRLESVVNAEVRSAAESLAQQLRGLFNAEVGAEGLEQRGSGVLREVVEAAVTILQVVSGPLGQYLLRERVLWREGLTEVRVQQPPIGV